MRTFRRGGGARAVSAPCICRKGDLVAQSEQPASVAAARQPIKVGVLFDFVFPPAPDEWDLSTLNGPPGILLGYAVEGTYWSTSTITSAERARCRWGFAARLS